MTESSGWASPGGDSPAAPAAFPAAPPAFPAAPPAFPPPPVAGTAVPVAAAPFGGPPPAWSYAQAPGAWTPPPKPGLIPLAPLTLGVILGASFRVLRRNPRPVLLVSLVLSLVSTFVTVLLTSNLVTTLGESLTQLSNGQEASTSQVSGLLLADLSAFAGIALTYIGRGILQGFVSLEVASGTVGERLPLGAFFAGRGRRIGVLVGWAIALVAAVIVFSIIVLVIVGALIGVAVASGNGGVITGVVVADIVLFFGGGVVLVWICVRLSMVPSVLMVERMTLGRAIGRSWRLTRRSFWRVFGIILLVAVIVSIASSIIGAPVSFIGAIILSTSHPTGASAAQTLQGYSSFSWIAGGVDAVIATILSVVFAASAALLYVDLRIRREGLDLQLIQYVDARQAGATEVPDPYGLPAGVPVGTP